MSTAGGNRPLARGTPPAWPLAVALAVHALAGAAWATDRDLRLLAHGARERYWVARVYDDAERGSPVTDVYTRSAGDTDWGPVARVEGRAVDLADRGGQLALLLDGGAWLLVSDETVATGRAPPAGVRLLALATRGDALLAAARVTEVSAATAPSTSPSLPTQASHDPDRLALFVLSPQGWAELGRFDVAGPLPQTSADVALAVVEGEALAAVREGPKVVTVYRQAGGGGPTEIQTPAALASFHLLGGGPVPVLWTVESDGATRLHWLTREGLKTVAVDDPSGGVASPAAATHVMERVRVVSGTGLLLLERSFDPLSGQAFVEAAKVRLPRAPLVPPMFRWVEPLLTVLLLFTIVSSLRRRREMQETMQAAHRLPLAPYGRRLLAGAIDAAPLFCSAALLYYWVRQADAAGAESLPVRAQVTALSGVVVYLLHTSVSEIAFGRTIGKAACGLRVVGLDGERAPPGAMLTRNLLRLIDLSMVLFPLVLVLYSPLRQRAGDVAAGTLVVLDKVGDAPAAEDAKVTDGRAAKETTAPAELHD